ncbi:MAG TPA: glycosyltransferase [Acidisphaera sp.]|nr:glycosyltransferase [Acidisphaera sp.]
MRHVAGAAGPPDGRYDADIVILSLDRPEETVAAIGSALAQSGISRHVFVVDQGSRPEALARIAQAVDGRADATLVSLGRNLGVPGGRNAGTRLGHGTIIAAIDNDAEFAAPDVVARAAAAFAHDPSLGAIGFRILVDATGEDDASSWGYAASLRGRAAGCFDAVTFVGCGHAIRRQTWDDAGAYDEALFFTWEEFDFCQRAIARGWRIAYRGQLCVRHKVCPEQKRGRSDDRWFYVVRNRLYIARKWGMGWTALAPRSAAYLAKGAYNGKAWQTVRAVAAAWAMARRLPPPLRMGYAARAYVTANDAAHRGSVLTRLRREVLVRLPATPKSTSRATWRGSGALLR